MIYRLISYIKFLFTSSNQHGVHSPFVFSYITNCLYSKPSYKTRKSINVLLKSIEHFKANSIQANTKDKALQEFLLSQFPSIVLDSPPFDLIFVESPESYFTMANHLESGDLHDDTLILIEHIHQKRETSELWEEIIKSDHFAVTIDMFYCGVLFSRKKQVKEHFRIRI